MADIEPGDVLRITARMTAFGQNIQNVYHYLHDGLVAVTEGFFDVALGAELDGAYSLISDRMSQSLLFDDILIYNVTQGTPTRSINWPSLTTGDAVVTMLPLQCAALMLFRSTRAKSVGRKYLGGFAEDMSGGGGEVEVLLQTDLLLYGAAILNGFSASAQNFVPGNWDPVLLTFAEWISVAYDRYFRTQRRRVVGVGT